jgi:hypothetical protein
LADAGSLAHCTRLEGDEEAVDLFEFACLRIVRADLVSAARQQAILVLTLNAAALQDATHLTPILLGFRPQTSTESGDKKLIQLRLLIDGEIPRPFL